ncbi:MAG: hypothetical protein WD767_12200 [Alphaproteobacteria bacterium]
MIAEALQWALTPAPPWARRAGYLGELIAIQAQYGRWRRQWAPHLRESKDAVRAAMEGCATHRHAMIYGSGPLLDIPLAELASRFGTVTLVDVAHLWPARLAARRFPNVRLVARDISGVAQGLLEGAARGASSPPRPQPHLPQDHESVDFLVSANVVSQLAVTPLRFLSRHIVLSRDEALGFAADVVHAHLRHLREFNATCCLITDTKREFLSRDGAVHKTEDQLPGIILPPHDRSWDWEIAPLGEISPDYSVRARMLSAIILPGNDGQERQIGAAARLDTV